MKPLTKGKFKILRENLGLVENSFLAKRECYFLVAPSCSPRKRVHESSRRGIPSQDECAM